MKNGSAALLFSFLIVPISVLCTVRVYAQEYTVTNGYVCDPKNPGGEETRRFYRQQDGLAINISPTATFPIVCPVEIGFDNPPYEISMGIVNTGNSTQTFSCALEENDLNGNKTRTQGNAVVLPPRTGGFIGWEDVILTNQFHYLSVRCILPPKGAVSWVEWY